MPVTWAVPERFINVFLQEISQISARHSMINQLNINVDRSVAALKSLLPLMQNMILFENEAHEIYSPSTKQHICQSAHYNFVYNIFICIQKYVFLLYILFYL